MYIDARLEQTPPSLWLRNQTGEARIFFNAEQIIQLMESGYLSPCDLLCRKPAVENQQISELLIGAVTLFPEYFSECPDVGYCPLIGAIRSDQEDLR